MPSSRVAGGYAQTRPQPVAHHSAPSELSDGSNDEFDDEDFQKF